MALKLASQSPQMKKRYPGNLGEHDLRQALDLLFFIKGKTYKKKSPEFIIPTADEFFTFCKFVSEEIYLKKTGGKKLFRSISSDKLNHNNYIDFYEYILHEKAETIYDRICLCLNMVFYALFLYFYTGIYMKVSVQEIKKMDSIQSYKQFFMVPMNWLCIHAMPSLEKYRKDIGTLYFNLYQPSIEKTLKLIEDPDTPKSFYKSAQHISELYDTTVIENHKSMCLYIGAVSL